MTDRHFKMVDVNSTEGKAVVAIGDAIFAELRMLPAPRQAADVVVYLMAMIAINEQSNQDEQMKVIAQIALRASETIKYHGNR